MQGGSCVQGSAGRWPRRARLGIRSGTISSSLGADQTELHENASSFAALATQARKKQEATVSGKVGKLFGI